MDKGRDGGLVLNRIMRQAHRTDTEDAVDIGKALGKKGSTDTLGLDSSTANRDGVDVFLAQERTASVADLDLVASIMAVRAGLVSASSTNPGVGRFS